MPGTQASRAARPMCLIKKEKGPAQARRPEMASGLRRQLAEKLDDLGGIARALERRQALPDPLAIGLGNEAWIADHQHAAVAFIADQAAGMGAPWMIPMW